MRKVRNNFGANKKNRNGELMSGKCEVRSRWGEHFCDLPKFKDLIKTELNCVVKERVRGRRRKISSTEGKSRKAAGLDGDGRIEYRNDCEGY